MSHEQGSSYSREKEWYWKSDICGEQKLKLNKKTCLIIDIACLGDTGLGEKEEKKWTAMTIWSGKSVGCE